MKNITKIGWITALGSWFLLIGGLKFNNPLPVLFSFYYGIGGLIVAFNVQEKGAEDV